MAEYTIKEIDTKAGNFPKTFDKIYDLYLQCFPIAEEQVPKENFIEILSRGGKTEKETWVYIEDKDGKIIGASNFDIFAGNPAQGVDGTIHDVFTFIDKERRKQGLFGELIEFREKMAAKFLQNSGVPLTNGDAPQLLTIIEQNDPFLTSPEQYLSDLNNSMDPLARRGVYEKAAGARQLDKRYIQPSVGDGIEPCRVLNLCVRGAQGGSVKTAAIRHHYERWFTLSFPEGTSIDDPRLKPMVDSMLNREEIPLLPPGRFEKLKNAITRERIEQFAAREDLKDLPIGEILKRAARQFYGDSIGMMNDILPTTAAQVERARAQGFSTSQTGGWTAAV